MRRALLAFLLWPALLLAGCTPPLTAEDARPFQSCAVDADCTVDLLSCDGCGAEVPIAAARQQDFEALRGCWEPAFPTHSSCKGLGRGGGGVRCLGGRCAFRPFGPQGQ